MVTERKLLERTAKTIQCIRKQCSTAAKGGLRQGKQFNASVPEAVSYTHLDVYKRQTKRVNVRQSKIGGRLRTYQMPSAREKIGGEECFHSNRNEGPIGRTMT